MRVCIVIVTLGPLHASWKRFDKLHELGMPAGEGEQA